MNEPFLTIQRRPIKVENMNEIKWKYKEGKRAEHMNGPLPKIQKNPKMNDSFLKIQRKPKRRKYKRAFSERPPPSRPNTLLQNTSFMGTDKSRCAFLDQNHRAELELMGLISGGLQSLVRWRDFVTDKWRICAKFLWLIWVLIDCQNQRKKCGC